MANDLDLLALIGGACNLAAALIRLVTGGPTHPSTGCRRRPVRRRAHRRRRAGPPRRDGRSPAAP
jgi:hypothetical protein